MQPVNTAFNHQTINFLNTTFEDIHDRKETVEIGCLVGWLVGEMFVCLVGRGAGWWVVWSAGWLVVSRITQKQLKRFS